MALFINDAFFAVAGAAPFPRQRLYEWFTTLSAASVMHYTIPTLSLTGDFDLTVEIMVPSVSSIVTASMILGNSGSTNNGLWVTSAGNIVIRDDAGSTQTSVAGITDGTLHTVRYVKTSGNVVGYIDGVEVEPSVAFGSFIIDRIGVRQATAFPFDGVIRRLRVFSGATLARLYPLRERTGSVIYDISGNEQHGATVNITDAERDPYSYESGAWTSSDGLTVIPVA